MFIQVRRIRSSVHRDRLRMTALCQIYIVIIGSYTLQIYIFWSSFNAYVWGHPVIFTWISQCARGKKNTFVVAEGFFSLEVTKNDKCTHPFLAWDVLQELQLTEPFLFRYYYNRRRSGCDPCSSSKDINMYIILSEFYY